MILSKLLKNFEIRNRVSVFYPQEIKSFSGLGIVGSGHTYRILSETSCSKIFGVIKIFFEDNQDFVFFSFSEVLIQNDNFTIN